MLRGTAGIGLGAAALSLIGCGGSGSGNSSAKTSTKKDASGLVNQPVDGSAVATRGGVLPRVASADISTFSVYPHVSSDTTVPANLVYSKYFVGSLFNNAKGEKRKPGVEPDI